LVTPLETKHENILNEVIAKVETNNIETKLYTITYLLLGRISRANDECFRFNIVVLLRKRIVRSTGCGHPVSVAEAVDLL
jgi:hypothetical protein